MFNLTLRTTRQQIIMLMILVLLIMMSISVCPAKGSEIENEKILSVFRSYIMSEAEARFADIRPMLSRRWRDGISSETLASISGKKLDLSLPMLNVVKSDGNTAIIEYKAKVPEGEITSTRHAYLVKEDGNWFIDSPFGNTPEWAVPPESKMLYDNILKQITEFSRLQLSDDVLKMQDFMNNHFSPRALVEQSAAKLVTQPGMTTRILSPISMTLQPIQEREGFKTVEIRIGRFQGFRKGADPEKVYYRRTGYMFVEESGQWKFLAQHLLNLYEVGDRFLELWQQGDTEKMNRLMSSNARICLRNGVEKTFLKVKNILPKVQINSKVESAENAKHEEVIRITLGFGDGAAWPSGLYQFSFSTEKQSGLPRTVISEIRYIEHK